METLIQTIKRLSEEDYKMLLENISVDKFSKPYIVLETARNKEFTDSEMIDLLNVNPSTYYTLKSRLNRKVASILSRKVENPISILMEEVSRIPASLYGTNKQVSIRAMKELEKQLLEYDLSNELIIVYRTLARLHMYNDEYHHYDRLYNKFVAFSLSSAKAENLFYDFIIKAGEYELTRNSIVLDDMESILREMLNISELYNSHRLFVFFNVIRIYYLFITATSTDALVEKEMEIDKTLLEMKAIFAKYPLDNFYNSIKFISEALYFEYYQRINNHVRARHHYNGIIKDIPELSCHHILNFHIIQFLNSKVGFYLATKDQKVLNEMNDRIIQNLYIEKDEVYNLFSFLRYQAIVHFYHGNYVDADQILNNMRTILNLKSYMITDMDIKLFQAILFAFMKKEEPCMQIANSVSRYLREEKVELENIRMLLKFLRTIFKEADLQKKEAKLVSIWDLFISANKGNDAVLTYLKLDSKLIHQLSRN